MRNSPNDPVEAAAKALAEHNGESWDEMAPRRRWSYRNDARRALTDGPVALSAVGDRARQTE